MVEVPSDRLGGVPLFSELDPAEREAIARRCAWRRVKSGETIISRGDEGRDVVWLVEGRARIIIVTPSGREIHYGEIGAGQHVGEIAAIDGGPRSADVVAIKDSLIACLPPADLHALLLRQPTVAIGLLRDLARIVRIADLRITELSTMGAVSRVCRELLRLRDGTDPDGTPLIRQVPTQETLAAVTGTTRETVARVQAQLAQAGLIRRRGRTLLLTDCGRLSGMAGFGDEDEAAEGSL
jgi:CRP-like cAMP-binding protein